MAVFATGSMRVAHKAAANLPQTATLDLFAVVGTVRLLPFSRVTTTLGASGGSVAKYLFTPAVGATASDLSTTADLGTAASPKFVFPWYPLNGPFVSTGEGIAASGGFAPLALPPSFWMADGTLQMNCTGNQTGQLEHWCIWMPMTPGSYVYPL